MLFPNYKIIPEEKEKDLQTLENQTPILKQTANFYIEGLYFIVIGFTSTATFYLVSSCLKDFSQTVAGMDSSGAVQAFSSYGIDTLASVIFNLNFSKKSGKACLYCYSIPITFNLNVNYSI